MRIPETTAVTHLRATLARALRHLPADDRAACVEDILDLVRRCEWAHDEIHVGTYAEPDLVIPVRRLRLEIGEPQQGELSWPEVGR